MNSNSFRQGCKVFYLKLLDISGKYIHFETEIKLFRSCVTDNIIFRSKCTACTHMKEFRLCNLCSRFTEMDPQKCLFRNEKFS